MTAHEDAAKRAVRSWISSPEGAQLLHVVYTGVRERWSPEYLAMLGQHYRLGRDQWPLEQVCCFGKLHVGIEAGDYGLIRIRAGGMPRGDDERAENAARLSGLPEPFAAHVDVDQHCGDSDGMLTWTAPIEVEVSTLETVLDVNGDTRSLFRRVPIPPGSVPLEIGTTQPSRTLLHMREDRGVARWPYNSDFVWLLVGMSYCEALDPIPADLVSSDRVPA